MKDSHRRLREGTRGAHDAVDAVFGAFDLTDRASYAAFLAAHAAVLMPLEDALDRAGIGSLIDDWPARRRSAAMTTDLTALDQPMPPPRPVAIDDNDAARLGALYVLEGSRLGGRMLSRRLPTDFPHAYLDPDQPVAEWSKLLVDLDRLLYTDIGMAKAVASAHSVFAAFEDSGRAWLARVE